MKCRVIVIASMIFISGHTLLSLPSQPTRYFNTNITRVPTGTTLYVQQKIKSKISDVKKQLSHHQRAFHQEYNKYEDSLYEKKSFLGGLITYRVPKYRLFGSYMLQPWKEYRNQVDQAIDGEMKFLHRLETHIKKAKTEELLWLWQKIDEKY